MAGGEVATWIHGGEGEGEGLCLVRVVRLKVGGVTTTWKPKTLTNIHCLFFFFLFRVSVGNDKTVECVVLEKKQVPTEKRESLRNKALNLLNLFELNR